MQIRCSLFRVLGEHLSCYFTFLKCMPHGPGIQLNQAGMFVPGLADVFILPRLNL